MSVDAQQNPEENAEKSASRLVSGDHLVEELARQLSQYREQKSETSEPPLIKGQMENRLTLIMEELAEETKAQKLILQQNRDEIAQIRKDIQKNQAEIERIHRIIDSFDRQNDVGLGELKVIWGY